MYPPRRQPYHGRGRASCALHAGVREPRAACDQRPRRKSGETAPRGGGGSTRRYRGDLRGGAYIDYCIAVVLAAESLALSISKEASRGA